MNQPEKPTEGGEARSLWDPEYLQKARQAVTQMLEGSLPTINEEYGPWVGHLREMGHIFERGMDQER